MKHIWRIAPPMFCVGEAESFYRYMASRGYVLQKAGTHLDRYRVGEPEDRLYRVEIAHPAGMPAEQQELYEACGWEYVTRSGAFYVFSAPGDGDAPEIHSDPSLQVRTVRRLTRSAWWSMGAVCLWILWILIRVGLLHYTFWGSLAEGLSLVMLLFAMMGTVIVWAVWQMRAAGGLVRRLRRGIPVDHGADWHPVRRRQLRSVAICAAVLTACAIWSVADGHKETAPLPAPGDASPILCLADVENVARTDEKWYSGEPESVIEMRSTLLAARIWESYERAKSTDPASDYDCFMYQDFYDLRFPAMAKKLAYALVEQAIFTDELEYYREVDVPGLDMALAASYEAIAVRDGWVMRITYIGDASAEDILRALALRWEHAAGE